MEAGKLVENLSVLWEEADLAERRNLLMAMRQRFSTIEITHSNASRIGSEPIFSYVHFQCEATNGLTVTL